MIHNDFVEYLNSLHNYNAQNPNAYGEKNIKSPFFYDVMVKVGLCDFISDGFSSNNPHSIVLTGHAGDGKTSIMYQVLHGLDIEFNSSDKVFDISLPKGEKCRCIKDFSEIADETKTDILREALEMPNHGNYTFMVANTGPLINTFGDLFSEEEKESAKIKLIDVMDRNTGKVLDICGYKICIINVASIDNTYFAEEFLKKITKDKLWDSCCQCENREFCHIKRNRDMIIQNSKRVYEFITMHYIWLMEHGKRLTIRSMAEQLAYMITGGYDCFSVKASKPYKYLFSNLFFGYVGTVRDDSALKILAVNEAYKCAYDSKRLRSDENLLVNGDFSKLFGKEIAHIISMAELENAYVSGWVEFLRRTYLMLNIVTDEKTVEYDWEDSFSKQFKRFCELRDGKTTPSRQDANLICDALSMIYIGTTNSDQQIPLTLSRESGIAQNVQLITGSIPTRNIRLVQVETKDSSFSKGKKRYILKIEVNKKILDNEITLPLLDYFEELKNGVISTNVDPQLSHGVESLKAQLSNELDDNDEDSFEMIILRNNGNIPVRLEITDSKHIREI